MFEINLCCPKCGGYSFTTDSISKVTCSGCRAVNKVKDLVPESVEVVE